MFFISLRNKPMASNFFKYFQVSLMHMCRYIAETSQFSMNIVIEKFVLNCIPLLQSMRENNFFKLLKKKITKN